MAGFFCFSGKNGFLSNSHVQNNSSWMNSIGGSVSFFSVKSSIDPNYLSVIVNIPTCPNGGKKDLTLFT